MKNTFTINDKKYTAKELDFNTICDMQDVGFDVTENVNEKFLSATRAYLAVCAGISTEDAGNEISAHMKSGKNLKELVSIFERKVQESDFFRKGQSGEEKTAPEDKTETDEKTE